MNNKETAPYLRKWVKTAHGHFAWPTDGCGYDQHIKFVCHRNENWDETISWEQFVLDYADSLDDAGRAKKG